MSKAYKTLSTCALTAHHLVRVLVDLLAPCLKLDLAAQRVAVGRARRHRRDDRAQLVVDAPGTLIVECVHADVHRPLQQQAYVCGDLQRTSRIRNRATDIRHS